jgi:hypothetical protein
MKPQVVSKLLAANALKSQTCFLGGEFAEVDLVRTSFFFTILCMMKTATPKQVSIYEKKIKYGRVLVSAPSGGGVRFMKRCGMA